MQPTLAQDKQDNAEPGRWWPDSAIIAMLADAERSVLDFQQQRHMPRRPTLTLLPGGRP